MISTREQGYTVSDATAEGLKATLYLQYYLEYVLLPTSSLYIVIDLP